MKGRLIIDIIAVGFLVAIACFFVIALRGIVEPAWHIATTAVSPDGIFVAESAGADNDSMIGRISVKRQNGSTVYEAIFSDAPYVFFKWADNGHLLVSSTSQSPLPAVRSLKSDGSVDVSYSIQ